MHWSRGFAAFAKSLNQGFAVQIYSRAPSIFAPVFLPVTSRPCHMSLISAPCQLCECLKATNETLPRTQYGQSKCARFVVPQAGHLLRCVTSLSAFPARNRCLFFMCDVFFLGTARSIESQRPVKIFGSLKVKAGKAATRRRLIAKFVRCQNSVVVALAVLVIDVVRMGRGRRAETRARELEKAAMAPVGSGMKGRPGDDEIRRPALLLGKQPQGEGWRRRRMSLDRLV